MGQKHYTPQDAMDTFHKSFDDVVESNDKWAAVVWHIKDGDLKMDVTTCEFPHAEMLPALIQLANSFNEMIKESRIPENPGPLPRGVLGEVFSPGNGDME